VSRRCFILLAVLGCQTKSEKAPEVPKIVEVRDEHDVSVASIHPGQPGRPCHAQLTGKDLVVDDKPSLESGGATWTTEKRQNGLAMLKDGQLVARIVEPPVEDGSVGHIDVVDPNGVALVRIDRDHSRITVATAGGIRLREGRSLGQNKPIQIGSASITGTDDRLLAALIAAPEVPPEIRAIYACTELSRGGG
jgi:hypothetical protein